MTDRYTDMSKEALRTECRDYEIKGYGKMNNEAMREALRAADAEVAAAGLDGEGFDQEAADREYEERKQLQERLDEQNRIAEAAIEQNHPMVSSEKPARASSGHSNGLKIEANRETRNGVTRPSIGGKCRAVWDMLDRIGISATAKQAREQASELGFDKTTTMVQFYRWRKFNGIEGRQ